MSSVSGLKIFRLFSFFVLLLAAQQDAYCQETEEQLKVKATELFEKEQYVEATSLYLRLLALSPRSTDYNYRYGTCLLFNSARKQDAFKYLNYAVTDPAIDIQAYYFLGKAYHLNYQFNEAIRNYELYKQKAGSKAKASFEIDRQIEMCQNGKRLLTTISDLIVLEKKEIETTKFFRLYDLRDIGGDIIVAADFQSKIDKKKGFVPLIHFPATTSAIYYASYGDSDKGQKDIYVRNKLPDGSWGLPQPVGGSVNTQYDEDFPYMHPNGEYLYFCSKGHNSMGGYDVFRSRFNAANNTFGVPENMDFAISSPDNDLFYVVDSLDKNAYFASSRQSSNSNIHVYKVRVDRVPLQLAVVKGSFSSSIRPENKKITISVTDYASGEKVGTFTSNEKGSYLITFPKGGKYSYEMKVEGSSVSHKYLVSLPYLKDFKPLKQKIVEETAEGSEVVKVIDLFNEEVEDPVGVLAEVIKQRSELNPNASQFNLEELDAGRENQKVLAELGFDDATPGAIIATFEQLENKQEEKVTQNSNLVNGALSAASAKLDEAARRQEEAKNLVNRSTSATSKEQKYALLTDAEKKINEVSELKEEARSLMAFSDSVSRKGSADRELLSAIQAVTSEVRKDVTDNRVNDLKEVITGNARTIETIKNSADPDPVDALIDEKRELQKTRTSLEQQQNSYASTEQTLKKEIQELKNALVDAKKKDVPGIESAINSKTSELAMVSEEKENLEKKIVKIVRQMDALDDRIAFLQDVTQVNSGQTVAPAEVQNKLNAVDTKNNNTLAAYIHQQVADMKKDPAIQALAKTENDPDQLLTAHDERIAAINKEGAGSPEEKQRKLLKADESFLKELDRGIAESEKMLSADPENEEARERLKQLNEIKSQTEERIAERKSEIAESGNPDSETVTVESELQALMPDYEDQLAKADGGTSAKKLEAQNAIDKQLLEKVEAEIAVVKRDLKATPGDKKLQARSEALSNLKTQTQERIADRQSEIAESGNPDSETITAESELQALMPDYEKQQAKANGSTPAKKLEAQNAIDKQLLEKVEAEIAEVRRDLKATPGNKELQARSEALATLKTQTQLRIADRNSEIAGSGNPDKPDNGAITAETELLTLMPYYKEQLARASGNTPDAKLEAQNIVDSQLLEKVEEEIAEVKLDLRVNPENEKLLARSEALATLKTQTEERIADRKSKITPSGNPDNNSVTAESELQALMPDYEEQLEQADGESPKAKLEAQNSVDQELLDKVNGELEDVEGQLLRNPQNEQAKQRQEALSQLKDQVRERISERNEAIADASEEPETSAVSLKTVAAAIRPEYSENTVKIEATMEDGPKKEMALLNEEKDLLEAIEKTIVKKESVLAKDPGNTALQQEIAGLKSAGELQEAVISEREQDLVAIEKAKIDPQALIREVLPVYKAPDMEKRENYSGQELVDFQKQEEQLQAKLVTRLRANEKKLQKAFNPQLAAENKVIAQLMEQSVNRLQQLDEPIVGNTLAEEQIQNDLGVEYDLLMQSEPASVSEAQEVIAQLNSYKQDLEKELQVLESSDSPDKEAIDLQEAQLEIVRKRIGVVEALIEEMQSSLVAENGSENPTPVVQADALTQRETELEKRIASGTLTPQEKKVTEKELVVVRKEREEQQKEELTENLATVQEERKEATAQLEKQDAAIVKTVLERTAAFTPKETENPTARELTKRVEQEERATVLLKTTNDYLDVLTVYDEKGMVVASESELQEQKRRFSIEIGQLESEIQALRTDPSKTAEVNQLETYKRSLESAVSNIDDLLSALEEEKTPDNPLKRGMEAKVDYQQEVDVASTPEYKRLQEQSVDVQGTRQQLTGLIRDKEKVRNQLNGVTDTEEREQLIQRLEQLSSEEKSIRKELEQSQDRLNAAVDNSSQPEIIRNLLARDVPPMKPAPVASQLLPELSSGFKLVETPAEVRTEKNIPVDVKAPTGLVYRVQVGAFAKPIPEDLFKEFTPVTGEQLNNGITRYLAGYFGNRTAATDAQRQIRTLGYADAFVVAYCDGERISVAEARRLEDLGLCVPKNQDSLMLEVVENRLAQLPVDSLAVLKTVVKPSDYNKAPGAVTADAVEERQGLFYTVQVGVYNRPVSADQVRNISPLITKRLENGQIRYSSGIFHSIEEARPKRSEAITRGITDAFITAYYKGERISLDEAKRLLAEQGTAILEPQTTPIAPNALETAREYAMQQPLPVKTGNKVQFVSKTPYPEYPRDVIGRLNNHGSFYYDPADGFVKSVDYVQQDAAVLFESLQEELDTVQKTPDSVSVAEPNARTVVAIWESPEITGATADWLLRLTLPHAGAVTSNRFVLTFSEVATENQEELIDTLYIYGASKVETGEKKP